MKLFPYGNNYSRNESSYRFTNSIELILPLIGYYERVFKEKTRFFLRLRKISMGKGLKVVFPLYASASV